MIRYRDAGVDIEAGEQAVALMKAAVQSTYGPEVLAGIGAFGGLYEAAAVRAADDTILVASTDGVGTKTLLAARLGRWEGLGYDIVNHCVNDILVQGARPLFFLDYIASARLDPPQVAAIVAGMAAACRAVGAALLGGETAEMPGVYLPGALDVVGTMVGVVRRGELIDGSRIRPGDRIIGLASSGLHTNGYSLARRVFADADLNTVPPGADRPLADLLLAPHRCYLPQVEALRRAGVDIRGLAHITGGGIPGNLPRILPPDRRAHIAWGSWPEPVVFDLIRRTGTVAEEEMRRVFNLGLGMLVIVPPEQVETALALSAPEAWEVGVIL